MRKVFAFENEEEVVDLEVSGVEEGEAASVDAEMTEEIADIGGDATGVEEAEGAADQLEEIQDVVEDTLDDENGDGEGIDEITSEAIRVAVEAVCARVGANPAGIRSIRGLYAVENFKSPSSRRANTQIALEGIGEFLKDLWEKIKSAVKSVLEKVKEFWNKHVSSLGRIKKALVSTRNKLSSSSGKLKKTVHLDAAPGALKSTFPSSSDISISTIETYVEEHRKWTETSTKFTEKVTDINNSAGTDFTDPNNFDDLKAHINKMGGSLFYADLSKVKDDKYGPFVGGVTYKINITNEGGLDREDGDEWDLDIDREKRDDIEQDIGISLSEKNPIAEQLKECERIIDDMIKYRDKQEKLNTAFSKLALAVDKGINAVSERADDSGKGNTAKGDQQLQAGTTNKDLAKRLRKSLTSIRKLNTKCSKLSTEMLGLNIKLAKGVIAYANLCMKHYS